ncbi:Beta-fructofuranosidase, insoluble isoenzyme 2 [Dichanthelium oligosanthes]|uniref:Beta-fructofuranosidase, insoluble isoenzyme 2 n=1 Tax=Dichanthelium oligosanthes TaxID=888268 RepID=A0A1E5WBK4_9POAL|nr:Beta-fructofuranosidase, insoluble isoenzyme 2 [Dichanthelium oligosanthes]
MGALVIRVACAWLLLLQLAGASHVIYRDFETEAATAAAKVPPSIVDPLLRTGYHFQPPKNWINAPMYYEGWYHFFYQYNPKGAVWDNIVWAHSVSRDLINWQALETAIEPSIPSDKHGCWSGSATTLPDGTPVIMYTGINRPDMNYQVQNVAYPKDKSDPMLREWVKPQHNPIIVPDGDINATQFRDPTTAWLSGDGQWRLLIGSAAEGGDRGVAYVYRSQDFKQWRRVQRPLHSAATGMWECPDFYPVSPGHTTGLDASTASGPKVKYVLKNSLDVRRYDYYTVGTYDQKAERYVPDDPAGDERHLRYDYGNFYASKTFYDPSKQRRVLWGWANESDTRAHDVAKGWAGIQAIPRKVWLESSGRQLLQWPIEEVEALRHRPVTLKDTVIKTGEHVEVTGHQTAQADVEVSFELSSLDWAEPLDPALAHDAERLCGVKGADVEGGVGPFGLWVLASANRAERTAVFFRVFKAAGNGKPAVLMCTDPTKSSLNPGLYLPTFAGFVDTDLPDGKISLRTLIDRSVVESFGAGGKTCILSRVYPSLAIDKNTHLYVFNNGKADVKVSRLTAWQMTKPLMNGA